MLVIFTNYDGVESVLSGPPPAGGDCHAELARLKREFGRKYPRKKSRGAFVDWLCVEKGFSEVTSYVEE